MKNENRQYCLDRYNCKIGQKDILTKSVVALVKYEIDDGNDIIVRHSNHYIPNASKHAEELFSDNIKNPTASSSVSGKKLEKITLYITSQPCHLSTNNTHAQQELLQCIVRVIGRSTTGECGKVH